ncbi:unnamed protein product [Prorocentrum cordatum]|uniref:Uncharacterized protein n=1 Tax=Prorocentrum cordatum TaxID=2364126 RepID=A0ABN9TXN1_9DINO|nr:unnamed protein product [Polarella glacialis]
MGTRSSRGGASYWYAFLCPRGGPCACVALPGPARATWPARVLPCQGRRLTFSQWAAPRPSKRLAYAAPSRGALGQTRPLSRADRSRDRGRCAGGWSVVERPGTDRPRGCPRRLWLSLAVGAWCLCCRDPELEAVSRGGRGRERRGYACASSAQRRQCGAAVREQGGIRTAWPTKIPRGNVQPHRRCRGAVRET